jgi:hypothetical protein
VTMRRLQSGAKVPTSAPGFSPARAFFGFVAGAAGGPRRTVCEPAARTFAAAEVETADAMGGPRSSIGAARGRDTAAVAHRLFRPRWYAWNGQRYSVCLGGETWTRALLMGVVASSHPQAGEPQPNEETRLGSWCTERRCRRRNTRRMSIYRKLTILSGSKKRPTRPTPTVPPAPVTFSMMTGWPSDAFNRSAKFRAITSVCPPGGNGTTMVIGRVG